MWASAQRDGRPAEHRWRLLFNAAVWLTPNTGVTCSNVAETRNPLKFPGGVNGSQPLMGRSPKFTILWGHVEEVLLFNMFFPVVDTCLVAKIQPDKVVRWCQNGDFLHPVFSESRVQHISDMHSKFALRPHHVWKYGRHPVSDRWDYGGRKRKKDINHRAKM